MLYIKFSKFDTYNFGPIYGRVPKFSNFGKVTCYTTLTKIRETRPNSVNILSFWPFQFFLIICEIKCHNLKEKLEYAKN